MTEHVVISRRQAADTGKTTFYTGKSCKHGHVSPRYVTNGGCIACMRHTYVPRRNPWSTLLVPYSNTNLWYLEGMSKADRVSLRCYLQQCIFAFIRQNTQGDLTRRAELENAMQEIGDRLRFASSEDPRNTD